MAKIKMVPKGYKDEVQYLYFCKGCGYEHAFELNIHLFNGNLEEPRVYPSLLENRDPKRICHSWIVDGFIEYLPDCFHELAGQKIPLPDIDEAIEQRKQALLNNQ